MAKQRHVGLVVFAVSFAIAARLALFEPKPHVPTAAEERWGLLNKDEDPLKFIRGLRYYIYGIGVLGLLIFAEDYLGEKLSKKKSSSAKDSDLP